MEDHWKNDGFSEKALWGYYAIAQLPMFWIAGVLEAPLELWQVLPRILGAFSFMLVGQMLLGAILYRRGMGDILGARRWASLLFGHPMPSRNLS